jgi:hypothetical protein
MSWHPRVFPWFAPPAAAPAALDAPGLAPGPRFNPFAGHAHVYQPQPFPGAPAFAYEAFGLVEQTPIGPATVNRNYIFPFTRAAPLYAQLGVPLTGLGGLSQGQFVLTPLLVDPSQLSEDLYAPGGVVTA